MIAYATHTGSTRNRAAIAEFGWRWFMTPTNNGDGYKPYALDNGAWGAFKNKTSFDETAFLKLVERFWENADFIVAPDIVEGGGASLDLSLSWLERLPPVLRLIPVQDGMIDTDIIPHLSEHVGIFLGGSTKWKLEYGTYWGDVARKHNAYYHIGRVNTYRRVIWCHGIGAHSFDGTSVSRYSSTIHLLDAARRQNTFLGMRK